MTATIINFKKNNKTTTYIDEDDSYVLNASFTGTIKYRKPNKPIYTKYEESDVKVIS